MDDNCIFCKIAKGEIPCHKVYEDNEVLAFLDLSQTTIGHTLVIPKEHYPNFLSTPQNVMHHVLDVAQRVGQAQMTELLARGVNILSNVGEVAGQSIPHFHVHVIPRYASGDGLRITMLDNEKRKDLNLPVLAEKIAGGIK
ncbi:MAG TPA: HIT family protein [Bacilli bacterium]|nr:HIT family protein [Bacilli bacterium]